MNNWTMSLAVIAPIERAGGGDALVFGAMLGADVGPDITVVGSLGTMIWLREVQREGLAVSGRAYVRLGLITTIQAVLGASFVLYLLLTFASAG